MRFVALYSLFWFNGSVVQQAPEKGKKGQTVEVNNFMNFLFMFLGGVYYLVIRMPAVDPGPTVAQVIPGVAVLGFLLLNRKLISEMQIHS